MKKYLISWLALIMLLTVLTGFSEGNKVDAQQNSFSDINGHWAEELILQAVDKGYVNGYSDRTFKPSQSVTIAEFMAMLVPAVGLEPSAYKEGAWYMPYMRTAYTEKWYSSSDFKDYERPITRLEAVKVLLNANMGYNEVGWVWYYEEYNQSLSKRLRNDKEYLLLAIEKGLITGDSIGDTKPKDQVTRAQAITFIERVLILNNGDVLEVDELAKEELINPSRDLWGNKKRTTNLPSNYDEYPYILEYLPNEVYMMGEGDWPEHVTKEGFATPKQVHQKFPFTENNFEPLKKNIETWFDLTFNIDYKTIDKSWSQKLRKTGKRLDFGIYSAGYDDHVDWVKKNKVKTTLHKIIVEPSTIKFSGRDGNGSLLRIYYEYSVDSGDKSIFENREFASNALFRGQTREHDPLYSKNYKFRDKITAVSEIMIGWNYQITPVPWSEYHIDPQTDLSANFIIIK